MSLPNFLIIGAQKSATSWLSVNLNTHKDVYIKREEVHFFNNAINYKKGLSWYAGKFNPPQGVTAIGEKTPEYMWVKKGAGQVKNHNYHVPELVYKDFPKMKLIVILRDPVERAISAYLYLIRGGDISPRKRLQQVKDQFGILEMGCYYDEIQYWQEFFPKEQMLIILKETDVDLHPVETLQKCCDFLGVDSDFSFPRHNERVNVGWTDIEILISYVLKYHQGIRGRYKKIRRKLHPFFSILSQRGKKTGFFVSQHDYEFLYEYYSKDYDKLEQLIEKDLSIWRRI